MKASSQLLKQQQVRGKQSKFIQSPFLRVQNLTDTNTAPLAAAFGSGLTGQRGADTPAGARIWGGDFRALWSVGTTHLPTGQL